MPAPKTHRARTRVLRPQAEAQQVAPQEAGERRSDDGQDEKHPYSRLCAVGHGDGQEEREPQREQEQEHALPHLRDNKHIMLGKQDCILSRRWGDDTRGWLHGGEAQRS